MANTEAYENIKEVEAIWDDIGGISNIKIDRPVSVHKTYLDSCTIKKDNINYTWNVSISQSDLTILWSLNRTVITFDTTKKWLRIPETWTYIITWYMSNDVDSDYAWYITKNNVAYIWDWFQTAPWTTWIAIPVSVVINFEEWDYMDIETSAHWTDPVDIHVTLTKLS